MTDNNNGNASAIREAAEKLVSYLPKFIDAINYYGIDGYYSSCYDKDLKELRGRMDFLKSALSASSEGLSSGTKLNNYSVMREALEEQLRYWNTHVRTRDEEDMRVRTEAALASPPRNCDTYGADGAAVACRKAIGIDWSHIILVRKVIGWLFAPAEGKEASNG